METDRSFRLLAAREIDAREALRGLRDCSREIERIAGGAHAIADHAAAEVLGRELRALRAQAQRVRAAICDWDTAEASTWNERVRTPLARLAAGVAQITDAGPLAATPTARSVGAGQAGHKRAIAA